MFNDKEIPKSAQIFGWILVLAGSFFAYVYMFQPALSFPNIILDTASAKFGLWSTGVRILGSVIGIVIALRLNSSALLALMLITRVFIELGDVLVGFAVYKAPNINTFTLCALAAIEFYFVLKLYRGIRK
jgi:hypothetical protein